MSDRSAVTFEEGDNRKIYVFIRGTNQQLYVKYFDGVQWLWRAQGGPLGSALFTGPAVVSYKDKQSGKQRIYAFVAWGNLHVNYWNGSEWKWADQGTPPGSTQVVDVVATTFAEAGTQRIYAFVKGEDSNLHVNYWTGSKWVWEDQGPPPGTTVGIVSGVVTYAAPGTTKRWIHVFVWGADKHLYVNYWNGTQWQWADHGTFPNTIPDYGSKAGAITFQQGSAQRIYAFFQEINSLRHYVNFGTESSWQWAFQGTPDIPYFQFSSLPRAITYPALSKRRIYVFATGKPGHLYARYWNGSKWVWIDRGAPAGKTVEGLAGAVSHLVGDGLTSARRIYVFARGDDGHLYANHSNGSQWQWTDHGVPPGALVGP